MAQHKFGTCRRIMLSFERQPFPAPCHVDQDVAHSRTWRALGHLTTFDRVLSALHRRNHLPLPPDLRIRSILPRASRCGQHRFAPGVHFGADSDVCTTTYIAGAAGPHSMRRATAGWIPCDFESDRRRRPLKKAAASAAGRRNDEQIRQLGHLGRSGVFHESDCPQISDIQAGCHIRRDMPIPDISRTGSAADQIRVCSQT